jgi:hypothetical protein
MIVVALWVADQPEKTFGTDNLHEHGRARWLRRESQCPPVRHVRNPQTVFAAVFVNHDEGMLWLKRIVEPDRYRVENVVDQRVFFVREAIKNAVGILEVPRHLSASALDPRTKFIGGHGVTHTAFGRDFVRLLDLQQPTVIRLESKTHDPTVDEAQYVR